METTEKIKSQTLGIYLSSLRAKFNMSLRAVEGATDKVVSNAYLSQLEKGKIDRPSPDILYSLSGVYRVPYESLMEKAGYLGHLNNQKKNAKHNKIATYSVEDLSEKEEEVLLEYLTFIRTRKNISTRKKD